MNNYANIMMIGRTGAGKSSFINYLVGQDVFKTGKGKPVTQDFQEFEYNDAKLPLKILDTKGLEVAEFYQHKKDIINYIKTRSNTNNIYNWIHTLFYVVNFKRGRFEPEEAKFINEMQKEVSQTVNVIITHCAAIPDDKQKEFVSHVKNVLDKSVNIFCVNSVEKRTRKGTHELQFGKNKILDSIFEVLWKDLSFKSSKSYAKRVRSIYMAWVDVLFNGWSGIVSKYVNDGFLTKYGYNIYKDKASFDKEWENYSDKCFPELEIKIREALSIEIKPIIDFYNNYRHNFDNSIKLLDCYEFLDTPGLFEKEETPLLSFNTIKELVLGATIIGPLLVFDSAKIEQIKRIEKERIKVKLAIPSEQVIFDNIYPQMLKFK